MTDSQHLPSAPDERAKIVAWLRPQSKRDERGMKLYHDAELLADAIERGDHLPTDTAVSSLATYRIKAPLPAGVEDTPELRERAQADLSRLGAAEEPAQEMVERAVQAVLGLRSEKHLDKRYNYYPLGSIYESRREAAEIIVATVIRAVGSHTR